MDAFELIQAVLAVPAAGSVLLILLGQQRIAVSRAISVGVTGLVFLLSVRLAALTELQGGFVQSAGLALQVDRIGALLLLAFSGVAFAVSLFASQLLEKEINENSVSHYYSVFFLLLAGLMGTATVSDLLGMYLCLEVVMLTAAYLVAAKGDASARQASAKYLVLNLCGSVVLLTGLIGIYRLTGQSNLLKLGKAMPNAVALHSTSMRAFTALVVAGLAVKSALFPLHTWLPDAHGSSATPSSVVISGLLVKFGYRLHNKVYGLCATDGVYSGAASAGDLAPHVRPRHSRWFCDGPTTDRYQANAGLFDCSPGRLYIPRLGPYGRKIADWCGVSHSKPCCGKRDAGLSRWIDYEAYR